MSCILKAVILLLIFNPLRGHCKSVLKKENISVKSLLSPKTYYQHGCDCGTKGTCSFVRGKKTCSCFRGYEEKDGKCTETCSSNEECENDGKCLKSGEHKFCSCKSGLIGDKCGTVFDCTEQGKFKGCAGSGGQCLYRKDYQETVCKCPKGKELDAVTLTCEICDCGIKGTCGFIDRRKVCICIKGHVQTNGRCTEACFYKVKCEYGGDCIHDGERYYCSCKAGLIGDKCEVVFDCTENGKYKACEDSGGQCSYDIDSQKALCKCFNEKKLHDTKNMCEVCDCGPNGVCSFLNGTKVCSCFPDYVEENGKCIEKCTEDKDCNSTQKCVKNLNICQCADGLDGPNCENNAWCDNQGKYKNCKQENGTCEYNEGERAVVCMCDEGRALYPQENRCKVCDCGPNGVCSFLNGKQSCSCFKGYAEENGKCIEKCTTNEDCNSTQKCVENSDGNKTCICADGLDGPYCENVTWCDDLQKYKNCKGENGTCVYSEEDRTVVCICADGRKLDPKENRCRDTCFWTTECEYDGECTNNGGLNFCSCKPGLIGDKCNIVFDCTENGKYKACEDSGGQCSYDIDSREAVCKCSNETKLHDIKHICERCDCGTKGICNFLDGKKICNCSEGYVEGNGRCIDKCTTNHDCNSNQKCVENPHGKNICQCADGLDGPNCENKTWCDDPHKYKYCKGENGTCVYSEEDRAVVCRCAQGRVLHPKENRCRETCFASYECKYEGQCINAYKHSFCSCKSGLIGDKCNTVFDCTEKGKYKACEDSGGQCSYDIDSREAVCKCFNEKKLHDIHHFCETCDCGLEGSCQFQDGEKICSCLKGFAEMNGTCIECNCGPYGSCKYEYGQKKCDCESFASEKNGVCVVMETTSSEGTASVTSTILTSTPEDCNCGLFSHSCSVDSEGIKVCSCFLGYSQLGGSCAECNCGVNAQSCMYSRNGTKECNCHFGYIQMNGHCSAVCNEDKCIHGKCEIIGKDFKCRCKDGFSGRRCEDKIETKSNKQNLQLIILLYVAVAALLSGVFCFSFRILKRKLGR